MRGPWRWLMIACGGVCLGLAVLGMFLPLLPTTPLVLLAAFFFSRGSERLHRWLTGHPRFGGYVRDWEAEQVIPLSAKLIGTTAMVVSVSFAVLTRGLPWFVDLAMGAILAWALWFIWSRPSRRS